MELDKKRFLDRYKLSDESLSKAGIDWSVLETIFRAYVSLEKMTFVLRRKPSLSISRRNPVVELAPNRAQGVMLIWAPAVRS